MCFGQFGAGQAQPPHQVRSKTKSSADEIGAHHRRDHRQPIRRLAAHAVSDQHANQVQGREARRGDESAPKLKKESRREQGAQRVQIIRRLPTAGPGYHPGGHDHIHGQQPRMRQNSPIQPPVCQGDKPIDDHGHAQRGYLIGSRVFVIQQQRHHGRDETDPSINDQQPEDPSRPQPSIPHIRRL